ncbi:MAG: hypothetical protein Q6366_000120 [Candidatus Freyarchaeota archaeon]
MKLQTASFQMKFCTPVLVDLHLSTIILVYCDEALNQEVNVANE